MKLAKPQWLRVRAPSSIQHAETRQLVRQHGLVTVCEEAACPNIGECWSKRHVTTMILGEICTRACRFCNVKTGKPTPIDPKEPERVAHMARTLELKHIVITSVDRDDLSDGGAQHFADVISAIRLTSPLTTIEILTPDFLRKDGALEILMQHAPDVYNHNLETVPRLYLHVRPGARYFHSLNLLKRVKDIQPNIFTKSGLMVGLGETRDEILQVMDDLRAADVDFLTIGQYLQPTPNHYPLHAYIEPQIFDEYAQIARAKGFTMVSSSPLTRSSYHAEDDYMRLKALRADHLNKKSTTEILINNSRAQ